MTFWISALRLFSLLWLTFVFIGIAIGIYLASERWPEGFIELVNPLGIHFWITWTVWGIAVAPGIGARVWAARLEGRLTSSVD